MDHLPVGSVVCIQNGSETINVALKTAPDNWALTGQTRKYTGAYLTRLAVERDGYALTVLHESP